MKPEKNSILPCFPAYVFGNSETPVVFEFSTTEEMLSIDWVKHYSTGDKFTHYAMKGEFLLAIYDNGFGWLMVGVVKNPSLVALPEADIDMTILTGRGISFRPTKGQQ